MSGIDVEALAEELGTRDLASLRVIMESNWLRELNARVWEQGAFAMAQSYRDAKWIRDHNPYHAEAPNDA